MNIRILLIVLFLLPLGQPGTAVRAGQADTAVRAGDPLAGKTLWEGPEIECRDCHGGNSAAGAFGPDLAGRNLTLAQFTRAVRRPWGVMPAFIESQISDGEMADLLAYFNSLPSVAQPGPWRREVPAGAPPGLEAATTAGCTQCHNPLFNGGRAGMGGVNADFEWFKAIVYTHTDAFPPHAVLIDRAPDRLAMGNFSRSRLPESVLQDIWTYISDFGFRPLMGGRLSAGVASANGVTYTLDVTNSGVRGEGLTAEDLTVTLIVPAGAGVIGATGAGYEGVRRDEQAQADVAVWRLARMAPKDEQTYTITLSRAGTAEDNLRGRVSWTRPVVKTGPSDSQNIAPAPLVTLTQ